MFAQWFLFIPVRVRSYKIWNVNCVRSTAFIFDTRTDGLVKVSKFLRQHMSRPQGRTPNFWIHTKYSKPIEISVPDISCPRFLNNGSGGIDIFWSEVNIWNVNCARATAFIFDTRKDVLVNTGSGGCIQMCIKTYIFGCYIQKYVGVSRKRWYYPLCTALQYAICILIGESIWTTLLGCNRHLICWENS